jgi:hypothetical protein|tara:strand:+ start:369 stop:746 length:378 start_codon:yes stop_codon:yes gene_type:complete
MKKRLIKIAEENDVQFKELISLCAQKLSPGMITGSGKNTWISDEGQEILLEAIESPEATARHISAKVIKVAPNKKYVYAYAHESGTKIPVLVPKKFAERLVGKLITVEIIEDVNGVSYRYRRGTA